MNIIYWRNPSAKEQVAEMISSAKTMKDLKLKFVNGRTGEQVFGEKKSEYLARLQSEPDFLKFYKAMLPGLTYPEIFPKKAITPTFFHFLKDYQN